MNIIVEGPDGAGKSTLVAFIANWLHWNIVASIGPAQNAREFNDRARLSLAHQCTVFDRHPIISERIYGAMRGNVMTDPVIEQAFYIKNNIIIYYRGNPYNFAASHRIKPHDTAEHLLMLDRKHSLICDEYDKWALERAHIIYRRGESKPLLLELIKGRLT